MPMKKSWPKVSGPDSAISRRSPRAAPIMGRLAARMAMPSARVRA